MVCNASGMLAVRRFGTQLADRRRPQLDRRDRGLVAEETLGRLIEDVDCCRRGRRRTVRAQFAHAPFQRLHPAIAYAQLAQVIDRIEQVVAAVTVRSPSRRQIARDRLGVESRHVALMGTIHGEGNSRLRPLLHVEVDPNRPVRP